MPVDDGKCLQTYHANTVKNNRLDLPSVWLQHWAGRELICGPPTSRRRTIKNLTSTKALPAMIHRMITFEDARRIAAATLSAHWDYAVEIEPHGREDDEDFMVFVRYDVEMLGGPIVLVTKADESVHLVPFISDPERWEAMLPTGGLTFEAHAAAGSISWHEHAPHLVGDADLVARVEAVLLASGSCIAVTPTGPFPPATPSSAEAVFAALLHLGRFEFSGDIPIFPIPFGGVA